MDNRKRPRPIIGNKRPPVNSSPQIQYKTNANSGNRPRQRPRPRPQQARRPISDPYPTPNNVSSTPPSAATVNPTLVTKITQNKFFRLIIGILIFILILLLLIFVYARFSPLNPDLSGNIGLYDISSNAAAVASNHRIVNVAVFGVDGREDVEGDRSDTIIIGSADFEHNKLKLTSLMRDTYTEMADEDYFDKLNAAYMIGGPEEAVKTINLNFDTAITDYVVVDFTALVAVVNAVGGIDLDITSEDELYWLNQYLMDVNDKVGTADPDVPGVGVQHLTGSQALAYARIRYVGNGDFERTQRQRNVLTQVAAKVFAMNPIQQFQLITGVLPYIQTSLRPSEMIKIMLNVLLMSNREIEQSRLPLDEFSSTGYLDDVSYVFPNTLVDNIISWYQYVYQISYTPSATAQEISEEIQETW